MGQGTEVLRSTSASTHGIGLLALNPKNCQGNSKTLNPEQCLHKLLCLTGFCKFSVQVGACLLLGLVVLGCLGSRAWGFP